MDNRVIIINSPYSAVKNGTVAVIENIKYNHFGKGEHLFVLAGLSHKLFREHEIRIYDK